MRVTRLKIENFRGISKAELHFSGHTLLIGGNNVGKSTVCEALDLVLGPDRLYRNPPVEEFDFRNGNYLSEKEDGVEPVPIRIEVVLTDLTEEIQRQCAANLEFWHKKENRLLGQGEITETDKPFVDFCLRLVTIARYEPEDDQFVARTIYGHGVDDPEVEPKPIPSRVKRSIGFLYLRALRTGSRALSLERGSLLDTILRLKDLRTGMWERIRTRIAGLDPPIDDDATELKPILDEIESRLSEYVSTAPDERATRLFVSQLTREHLRKTISFFLSMCPGESPVPFQDVGTGTLSVLVLALLSFIAEIKKDNVIFAMEEPEIALPPYTQRRITNYLLTETAQCFVTSHSPYVIERFSPDGIVRLTRDNAGILTATPVNLPASMKAKTYRAQLRRAIAEAMLGHGAIVGEGPTELFALGAAARKMEEANSALFPLDLAGITIINTEGDGNLDSMGAFFNALGIPAFALYDRKKNRTDEETAKIEASFTMAKEIAYTGFETLLAEETPTDRQWEFLEGIRSEDPDGRYKIPATRPDDKTVKSITVAVLKALKGEGGAARLIEVCSVADLPATVVDFLTFVYAKFPRPEKRLKTSVEATAATTPDKSQVAAAAAGSSTDTGSASTESPPSPV
jgi:putative ATP-dependent endonuclease of OLD family